MGIGGNRLARKQRWEPCALLRLGATSGDGLRTEGKAAQHRQRGHLRARRFGAQGFPTLAVVDREGRLDSLHVGLIEYATLEEIVSEVAAQEPGAG